MTKGWSSFIILTSAMLILVSSHILHADTTHTIKKGDTCYRIARLYNISTDKLIDYNDLNPTRLKPGNIIVIPEARERPSAKKLSHKKNIKSSRQTLADNDLHVHIVKKGDTLSSLALRYSLPAEELKKLNNLSSTTIKLGQPLIIRVLDMQHYTVMKGDTLSHIAKKYHVTIDELRTMNNLLTDTIRPGQVLLVQQKKKNDSLTTHNTFLSSSYDHDGTAGEDISESQEITQREKIVAFAKKLLNIPYRFGGSSLFGIDCSAFVQKVYRFVDINLPRSAREQYVEGNPVDRKELTVGDLVFFRTYASFPSHVGIYLGDNRFIHASSAKRKVSIDNLDTPYYLKRFIGAKRILESQNTTEML
jgi:cell wall-associated NlpC family hydrolase